MLVLSRRVGEELWIDDNIRVVVLETRRGQVRLGIQAPRDVPVLRKELLGSPKTMAANWEKQPGRCSPE